MMDIGVQVIVPLLGDSFQLGLPALGREMVVAGQPWGPTAPKGAPQLPSPLLCTAREFTALCSGFTIFPRGEQYWVVSKSRVNPEVLQTSNSLGNRAVPSYVFCTHRLGPQSTPSGRGKPFVLGTLTLSKGEGKIALFFPLFLYFCCSAQGLALGL